MIADMFEDSPENKPNWKVALLAELRSIAALSLVALVLGWLLSFALELPARHPGAGLIIGIFAIGFTPVVMVAMVIVVKLSIFLLGRFLNWANYEAHTLFGLFLPVEKWLIRCDDGTMGARWSYTAIALATWGMIWLVTAPSIGVSPNVISHGNWFTSLLWALVFTLPLAPLRVRWKFHANFVSRSLTIGDRDI